MDCRNRLLINIFRQGSVEEKAVIDMKAGESVDVLVEYINTPPPDVEYDDISQPALMRGVVRRSAYPSRIILSLLMLIASWWSGKD
jgi:hypothetical protein